MLGGGGGQVAQHMTQPQVGFEAAGLGGLDQRVERRAGVGPGRGISEQPRFAVILRFRYLQSGLSI